MDVKKAHLYGMVPEDVSAYVGLPCGKVWKLKQWLYGMRNAAQAREEDFATKLQSIGFVRGIWPRQSLTDRQLVADASSTATTSRSFATKTWATKLLRI